MTILIIGLGSMGCRRLRLLKQLRPDIRLCGVDTNDVRRASVEREYGVGTYAAIEQAVAMEKPEAAVICTSPLTHAAIIRECLLSGLHVFSELNLVTEGYGENIALAQEKKRVLFMSSTFLYRKEVRYLIAQAKGCSQPLNYRYHVGQYLPDWHPWEDYTKYFVGDARTNGCRELFAIELPWLQAAFGPVESIKSICKKITGLHTAYADSYFVLLTHENGHMGSLCVDVVSRKPVRLFELYGEEMYITWGGTPESLHKWNTQEKRAAPVMLYDQAEHQEGYAPFVVENAYRDELAAYLTAIEQGIKPTYGFAEDWDTLRLADAIEKASS